MGRLTDNMYNFADNVTAIPGNLVGGISDIVGGGKNMLVSMFGIPPKFYNAIIDGGSTIVNTPQALGNNAERISDNAANISNDAKETVNNLKPILIIGMALFAFKTITDFDSQETGSNLARVAMFA